MNRNEMMKLMEEAHVSGGSKLHLRSESIQSKDRVKRIPNLKKALKKKSKLLIITDLAFPFNPETGKADDSYNADNKYRPPFSATTVALSMKEWAAENEALKETLMKRAGVSEWDLSDTSTLNETDINIFIKYRVPRVFTVPVVHVNIPVMTKYEFGRDYAISVTRDPMTGDIIGEVPGALKVNKLFRDIAYEKLTDYQKRLDSGEINHTEKQQKQYKSDIYGEIPVSDDHPSNWITAFELPLTSKYEISSDCNVSEMSAEEARSLLVLSRYSKSLSDAVKEYTNGNWEKFDKYLDYFEIDMNCPTEGDADSNQGKMLIGKDTKFEKPTYALKDENDAEKMLQVLRDCTDSMVDIEEQVRVSMRITPYSQSIEDQIYTSLKTILDVESNDFVTKEVIMNNSEVITLAFGDTGAELVESADADVLDKKDGDLDEEKAKEAAKQYDLTSADFHDDIDDVNLEEVDFDENIEA